MARTSMTRAVHLGVKPRIVRPANRAQEHRDQPSAVFADAANELHDLMMKIENDPDRPAKRRRIEQTNKPIEAVDLNHSSLYLEIEEPAITPLSTRQYLDMQDDVDVRIIVNGDDSRYLVRIVQKKPGKRFVEFKAKMAGLRKDEVSPDLFIALEVSNQVDHHSNPPGPGRLWTRVDMELASNVINGKLQHLTKFDFTIKLNLTNSLEWVPRHASRHPALDQVFEKYLPSGYVSNKDEHWSPQDFYRSVHVPKKDHLDAEAITIPGLDTGLYPFQKRAVKWLLQREGVCWTASKGVEPIVARSSDAELPYSFRSASDSNIVVNGSSMASVSEELYISDLFKVITKDIAPYRQLDVLNGGILSEEMGLGKTVEMTALIALHKRDMDHAVTQEHRDLYSKELVQPVGATLIITPPSILTQWFRELNRHAPHLRVMHYQGIKSYDGAMTAKQLLDVMAGCDVVLTTYNVLSSEIHYTKPPPDRSMRHAAAHPRPKSPLTLASWWRVCLDEAQMVESGVSNAAQVARLIPRVNAWGVTGTPMRKDVGDLLGLLCFLRLEPFATLRYYWDSLIRQHKDAFTQLFSKIAMRHTKHIVRDELHLPGQQRFVITLPFTPIEEQYYKDLFEQMCEEVQVDSLGAPLQQDWAPDSGETIAVMRYWLQRLRQTVLHPEVGGRNRRALGNKDGPLRTVEEVLAIMLEQSETSIRTNKREIMILRLKRGQYYENSPRVKEALELWTEVRNEAVELVAEARQQLAAEVGKIQHNGTTQTEITSDDDTTDNGAEAGSELHKSIGIFRNRLRTILEVEHMAVFFQANANFQIKSNEEVTPKESDDFKRLQKLEDDGYDLAKKIRQEILKEVIQRANRFMKKISRSKKFQSFVEIPPFPPEFKLFGGIESRSVLDKLNVLAEALDAQANQFDEWRENTIQLLLKPLVDQDDEKDITGDEYEDSTKIQEELLAYVTVLRTVVEDRHQALTGQVNRLIMDEATAALKFAENHEGPAPELMSSLMGAREEIKPREDLVSLRAITVDVRTSLSSLKFDADGGSVRAGNEYMILDKERLKIYKLLNEQNKAVEKLRQEIDFFARGMNLRLEFYRQLQQISDMVAPLDKPKLWHAHDKVFADEVKISKRIASDQTRRRFLLHLQDSSGEEARKCVICLDQIEIGSLTICGHQFCKECMLQWWRQHKTCPTCKHRLKLADLQDISYKPREVKVAEEVVEAPDPSSPNSKSTPIYLQITNSALSSIQNVELPGRSFGTKIDTIARHIIWLRETDPGSKSIVFSQFKDFLEVLGRALRSFRIGFSSIDSRKGTQDFKEDPAIECFLLHGKAQSSGLNLVVASHVFLCEPLINTALELQAIARVDRIGQKQKTSVYLYLIQDTIEEAIYDISVKRRMAHLGQTGKGKAKDEASNVFEGSIEEANSAELQRTNFAAMAMKGKGSGEHVDKADLWSCLFGNAGRRTSHMSVGGEVNRLMHGHLAAEAAESRINGEE